MQQTRKKHNAGFKAKLLMQPFSYPIHGVKYLSSERVAPFK